MNAVTYDRFGSADVLQLRNVEQPRPGPGEILVRVHAAALNPKDVLLRKGKLRFLRTGPFPKRVGYDWAGEVLEVGPRVSDLTVGNRVYGMIQASRGGAVAELCLARRDQCARMPMNLGFREAASLPLASLTALQALRNLGGVGPGDKVCILGASGGVGTVAIQIAKILGAHVTTTSSAKNREHCRALGADTTLDYATTDPLAAGDGYQVVFDVFGNRRFDEAARALAKGGVFISTVPSPRIVLDMARSLFTRARARLVVVQSRRRDLETLAGWVEGGRLRPVIDSVFPLRDVVGAQKRIETKRARGKVVIAVDPREEVAAGEVLS